MDSTPGLKLHTLAGVTLLALAGCIAGGSSPAIPVASPTPSSAYRAQPPADVGGTLVLGDWEPPLGFDILAPATEGELRAAQLLFAPLWGLDPNLNAYPDLVREVPTTANGQVRTGADGRSLSILVRLIPGLRWSDGQPLTADDVVFTWKALCDPASRALAPPGLDRIQDMERRSDTELIWHLEPAPGGRCGRTSALATGVYGGYLQTGAGFYVMPAHRLQPVTQGDWHRTFLARPDVVSGPFTISQLAADRVTFAANPGYPAGRSAPAAYSGHGPRGLFDHAPYLAQLVLRVYPSKDAEVAALRGGEADLGLHLSAVDLADLEAIARSRPLSQPGLRDEFLNPNHATNSATRADPPWVQGGVTDTSLLDALALALDRPLLGRQALGVDLPVTPAAGLFPSALAGYADASLRTPRIDLEGARRLLEQDGWKLSGRDPIRSRAGRRLDFEVLAVCGSASAERELKFLHDAWEQVGASVRPGCRPRAQFFASLSSGGVNASGAFDMTLYSNSWGPDPDDWASFAAADQEPSASLPQGSNWNRCRDPELNRAFADGAAALKASVRRDAYLRAQREWLAYHCTIPLFEWPQVRQVSGLLHNFRPHPVAGLETWNAADWWLRS